MKILKSLPIIILVLINSCTVAQSDNKQKALAFLGTIQHYDRETTLPSNNFQVYFKKANLAAQSNKNFQLNAPEIDSARLVFEEYMNSCSKAINNLKSLKEFDDNIPMLPICIKMLSEEKRSHEAIVPVFLRIYRVGWNNASEEEKNIILNASNQFAMSLNLLENDKRLLNERLEKFKKKYKIGE